MAKAGRSREPRRWEKVPGRTGVYRRGNRYQINFRDSDGTVRWRVVGDNPDEAERARKEILRLAKRGIRLPGRTITIAELRERWLEKIASEVEQGTLSRRTYIRYSEVARSQIQPRLGKQIVRNIDRFAIAAFVDELRTRGLARTTQELVLKTLSQLLAYAVETGFHGYNPVTEFRANDRSRPADHDEAASITLRILDETDLERLLEAATWSWRPGFIVAARAGLRSAELLALEWRDVHMSSVRVRRLLLRDGTLHEFDRTDPRRREIPISAGNRIPRPPDLPDPLLRSILVVGGTEKPRSARSLDLAFHTAASRAGLVGNLTASALRDTFAARLIHDSTDCLDIAGQLGQSFESVYRRYTRVFAAAGRLEAAKRARREARKAQPRPARAKLPPLSPATWSGEVVAVPVDEVEKKTGRKLVDIRPYSGDPYLEIRGNVRREVVHVPVELVRKRGSAASATKRPRRGE
jgi:integrase